MKDTHLNPTRRGFLKIAALGGALPTLSGRSDATNFGHTPRSKVRATAHLTGAPSAPAGEGGPQLDHAALTRAVTSACDWITDIAQMKTDTLSGEQNSHKLEHQHWRGALRGEYRASTRQWDFFCPV